MKKYLYLLLIILGCLDTPFSQSLLYLNGEVADAQTQQAISFAHIALKNTKSGAISDYDGKFALKISSESIQDTLLISCIGYQTQNLSIASVFENANQKNLTITLEPDNKKLDTILISSDYKLTDLILEALAKVEENYYQNKTVYLEGMITYYVRNLNTGKKIRETEAYTTAIRPPINGFQNPKIIINLARTKRKILESPPVYKVGNAFSDIIEKDLIPSSFKKPYFKNYQYQLKGLTKYEGELCYHLYITSLKRDNEDNWQTEVLIDTMSLAVAKIDLKMSDEGNFKSKSGTPLYHLLFKDLYTEASYYYQKKEDKKWYLNNVSIYKRFFDKILKDSLETFMNYEIYKVHKSKESANLVGQTLSESDFLEKFAVEWDHPVWQGEEKKKKKNHPRTN